MSVFSRFGDMLAYTGMFSIIFERYKYDFIDGAFEMKQTPEVEAIAYF